jgi:hypothetical protein
MLVSNIASAYGCGKLGCDRGDVYASAKMFHEITVTNESAGVEPFSDGISPNSVTHEGLLIFTLYEDDDTHQ